MFCMSRESGRAGALPLSHTVRAGSGSGPPEWPPSLRSEFVASPDARARPLSSQIRMFGTATPCAGSKTPPAKQHTSPTSANSVSAFARRWPRIHPLSFRVVLPSFLFFFVLGCPGFTLPLVFVVSLLFWPLSFGTNARLGVASQRRAKGFAPGPQEPPFRRNPV